MEDLVEKDLRSVLDKCTREMVMAVRARAKRAYLVDERNSSRDVSISHLRAEAVHLYSLCPRSLALTLASLAYLIYELNLCTCIVSARNSLGLTLASLPGTTGGGGSDVGEPGYCRDLGAGGDRRRDAEFGGQHWRGGLLCSFAAVPGDRGGRAVELLSQMGNELSNVLRGDDGERREVQARDKRSKRNKLGASGRRTNTLSRATGSERQA